MQLCAGLLLSAVFCVVTPTPTPVEKAERLLYNLLDRVLSLNRNSSALRGNGNIVETAKGLGFSIFVKSLDEVKLEETVSTKGPLTVMAPTNEAFKHLADWETKRIEENEKVLENLLKYHVMEKELKPSEIRTNDLLVPTMMGGEAKIRFNTYHDGKVITASGRPIKMDGHKATNGMLYEVEGVMIPPMGTIAAELKGCPVFKILTMALEKTNMKEMLNGEGPYTMFAPTDKAFGKIPKATLDSLMKDPAALKELLMYHIVPGTYYSAGLTNGDSLKTESGKMINIKIEDENVEVNTVPVSHKDATTTNGCVHVVESVLMPPTTRLVLVF